MADNDQPTESITIPYVEARDFKVAAIDNTLVTKTYDGVATTFELTFTRVANTPQSETFKAEREGDSVRQIAPTEYNTQTHRIKECAVLMRPDHAMNLIIRLTEDLSKLTDEQKARYNIPRDFMAHHSPLTLRGVFIDRYRLISDSGVLSGSRPSTRTRLRTSRSVKMPARRPSSMIRSGWPGV